jgi:hypothetical protein
MNPVVMLLLRSAVGEDEGTESISYDDAFSLPVLVLEISI